MSNELNQVAEGEALDDFLISLAEGVASAQSELNQLIINSPSGNGISYQIPKLEFELKLQVNTQQTSSPAPTSLENNDVFQKKGSLLRVASPTNTQQSSAASIIKGVLMAMPMNNGKPGFQVQLNMGVIKDGEIPITVDVSNVLGEPQVNVEVEINIDRQESKAINQQEGRMANLSANTYIKSGVVLTGVDGSASTTLVVDNVEPTQTPIVVTVDTLMETASLIYRVH